MSLTVYADDDPTPLPLTGFSFPGGERQVRFVVPSHPSPLPPRRLRFVAHVWCSEDWFDLLLAVDAAERLWPNVAQRELILPYLPYARQDRVCAPGEAASLAVVARLLNGLRLGVVTWDVHNPMATEALVDRLRNRPASDFVVAIPDEVLRDPNLVIVAPDEGAFTRAMGAAIQIDRPGALNRARVPVVQAVKTRDPRTGTLSAPRIAQGRGNLDGATALIVDDICDGGRTFVNLAGLLRAHGARRVLLYVTHGIFSAGYTGLSEAIDHVYVANLAETAVLPPADDLVTVLRIPA